MSDGLVTNGRLGKLDPQIDALVIARNAMGLGVANAAKDKAVGLLAEKLRGDGIYVGQVHVLGPVKGTPFDDGTATIEARAVSEMFWSLYHARSTVRAEIR